MNELEELKKRAADAQEVLDRAYERGFGEHLATELKADLDRAIAIAERKAARVEELRGNRLDEVEAALGRSVELVDRLARERDEAIAAALALRDAFGRVLDAGLNNETLFDTMAAGRRVLAEYAWLEEHR